MGKVVSLQVDSIFLQLIFQGRFLTTSHLLGGRGMNSTTPGQLAVINSFKIQPKETILIPQGRMKRRLKSDALFIC